VLPRPQAGAPAGELLTQSRRAKVHSMVILAPCQVAALRFMAAEPLEIHAFSSIGNVEEVAAMLDGLAKQRLCRRSLRGLSRIYEITPAGLEKLAEAEPQERKLSAA
jgi:hypothetical protein